METQRLILREARLGDDEDLYKIRNSEYVLKYNCMKKLTREELAEQIKKDVENSNVFHIELKESKRVIGVVCIDPDSLRYGVNSLCISYYLGEEFASKGYMTEALREIVRYIFEERQAEVLAVRVFKNNMASRRLVEKLGFVNEGCIRRCVKGYENVIYDDMIYSILKEEYNQTKA
jgi:ribosomal-protein-alanine N-acetyltransferase